MGACDCHMHLFGPAERYPYAAGRSYTPPDATMADYLALRARLGLERTVFVQPSVYGHDHRLMLDALAAGGDSFRGVAVLPTTVEEAELARLHAAGVRGVRVNLVQHGGPGERALEPLAARIAPLGWHVQVYAPPGALLDLAPRLGALPTAVVIDHYGSPSVAAGTVDPAFRALLGLVAAGRTWVKLSAPYIALPDSPDQAEMAPFARALIQAAPERMLFATNWPHPNTTPFPDDARLLASFRAWAGGAARRILEENPATLYGFAAG